MFQITADIKPAVSLLGNVGKQLPFAISKAINVTLNQGQEAERDRIRGMFILRRPDFILNTVKILSNERATKTNLVGRIRIDPERNFLAKFETVGVKRPISGSSLAVPGELLSRKRTDVIPARLRPKALQLTVHRTKSGKIQFKGEQRTFIAEKSIANYGVLQRIGRGKGSRVMVLYWFQHAVHLDPLLAFERTLRRIVHDHWDQNMTDALAYAIATAK